MSRRFIRWALTATAMVAVVVAATLLDEPGHRTAVVIAAGCLLLWLAELVPPYVPTLLLAAAVPVFLGGGDPRFELGPVLGWAAEPVLALFFGGFALGVAAQRHHLDASLAAHAVRLSGGRLGRLAALVLAATAFLSMWMSNVAAAAMMLAAIRPLLSQLPEDGRARRGVLLCLAAGANFGGIATPVGTGPNGLAIASLEGAQHISFPHWMLFAVPLTGALLLGAWVLVSLQFPLRGHVRLSAVEGPAGELPARRKRMAVAATFGGAALLWLLEPWLGLPAPAVALGAAALLFGTGLLIREDLDRLDWSTLFLIAGGLLVGRLLEEAGVVELAARSIRWEDISPLARTVGFVVVAAALSALMSNTATVALLLPLALAIDPRPSMAILIAVGASTGVPFAISTPPNAMVRGAGVTAGDLLRVGIPLMLLGALAIALTGHEVLGWAGIRVGPQR